MTDVQFWPDEVNRADLIVTASAHSAKGLGRHFHGEIAVCPEGVDPHCFRYLERHAPGPGERFRWLWVNNTSDEKGFKILLSAWRQWEMSGTLPWNCELYIKASGRDGGSCGPLAGFRHVTFDDRNLPLADLLALYAAAHGFVQCSHGEAWGLTLTEAMSTGLPCIWTHWGGVTDYADETVGFPVTEYGMVPFGSKSRPDGEVCGWGARAHEEAVVRRMIEIMNNYELALQKGRHASERMHQYSWIASAKKFLAICERFLSPGYVSDLTDRDFWLKQDGRWQHLVLEKDDHAFPPGAVLPGEVTAEMLLEMPPPPRLAVRAGKMVIVG